MLALISINYMVSHQYREKNKVANFLTRQGKEGLNCTYGASNELPLRVRGLLRLDFLDLPSIRP